MSRPGGTPLVGYVSASRRGAETYRFGRLPVTAPGPLADEARLLVEAAREWAARAFPEAGEHLATCQWCPLCRGVAALRSPDVAD